MRRAAAAVVLALAVTTASSQTRDADPLGSVVTLKAKIQQGARSAATLGMQRTGAGVVVREGYVLTIGYLVVEAEAIQVTDVDGKTVPATLAGYDHASGFGLLKLAAPVAAKPLPLGDSTALAEREQVLVATTPSRDGASVVNVISRRPFSGSWEYLLSSAIYTYPPVDAWSGAALISGRGELLGVGSLIVGDAGAPGTQSPGNMFVPIDLLKPILDDLIARGKRAGPAQPWLGVTTDEMRGRLFVSRVSPDSPADRAGLKSGDILLAVAGQEVGSLPEFYRRVWARGAAGVEVPLKVLQGAQVKDITVRSIDRFEYFRTAFTH